MISRKWNPDEIALPTNIPPETIRAFHVFVNTHLAQMEATELPIPEPPEPEITPEMIEAGLHELLIYSPKEDSFEFAQDVVSEIFRAMWRASRSS